MTIAMATDHPNTRNTQVLLSLKEYLAQGEKIDNQLQAIEAKKLNGGDIPAAVQTTSKADMNAVFNIIKEGKELDSSLKKSFALPIVKAQKTESQE